MKKINGWKFAGAILIISCIFTGCGVGSFAGEKDELGEFVGEKNEPGESVGEIELNVGAADMESMTVVQDSSGFVQSSSGQDKNFSQVSELNRDLFDGSDMQLWDGGDERLMVLKENILYLYDVAKGSILAEKETEQWHLLNIYPCNEGFCIIGSLESHKSNKNDGEEPYFTVIEEADDSTCLAVFLDNSLQEKDRVVLNDIVEYPDAGTWTVSPDMSKLAYFNLWDGLCLYECGTKTIKQLLDFSDSGTGGSVAKASDLLAIDALFFEEGGEGLVFTGGTDRGNITAESWGRINLDGTGFENHIFEKNAGIAAAYKNGKLLLGEDSLTFEKRMAYVDVATGEEKYSTNLEGGYTIGGPYFSDRGETFAVVDMGGTNQIVLTLYNRADFSEICQEVIQDEKEEYFYSLPKIYLFDELRVCLVCMGGYEIPMKSFFIRY